MSGSEHFKQAVEIRDNDSETFLRNLSPDRQEQINEIVHRYEPAVKALLDAINNASSIKVKK